jgi:hypothetical protein
MGATVRIANFIIPPEKKANNAVSQARPVYTPECRS